MGCDCRAVDGTLTWSLPLSARELFERAGMSYFDLSDDVYVPQALAHPRSCAPNDVQPLPVDIDGHPEQFCILIATRLTGQTSSSGKSVRSNSSSGPSGRHPGGGGVARSAAMTCSARD